MPASTEATDIRERLRTLKEREASRNKRLSQEALSNNLADRLRDADSNVWAASVYLRSVSLDLSIPPATTRTTKPVSVNAHESVRFFIAKAEGALEDARRLLRASELEP
jgi:hypothetical protein